jgi:hypothetical protein
MVAMRTSSNGEASSSSFLRLPGGAYWWLDMNSDNDALVVSSEQPSRELVVPGRTRGAQAGLATTAGQGAFGDSDGHRAECSEERQQYSRRRTARVSFTCNLCLHRNERRPVNPDAMRSGSVFVSCTGCASVHKLVDNLNIFDEVFEVFPPPELRRHFLDKELYERISELDRDNDTGREEDR